MTKRVIEIMVPKKYLEVTPQKNKEALFFEIVEAPENGKCVCVKTDTIHKYMFKEKRSNKKEEALRILINEAFKEAEKAPKYYEEFYILIPKWKWVYKTRFTDEEMEEYPEKICGTMSNWVEIALYLAQLISNEGDWEKMCKGRDHIDFYRIFKWKDGTKVLLGGAKKISHGISSPADINWEDIDGSYRMDFGVPSVTIR